MKKLLIGTALILTALPFTFDGVTPAVSKAHAIIGRPLTPLSVAGVHRRAVRGTFGVGANIRRANRRCFLQSGWLLIDVSLAVPSKCA